jgi:hypothetical protein
MICAACGHEAHAENACQDCGRNNGTCWQRIRITGGDGDQMAAGQIDLATGMESKPCMNCKSFEKDNRRLQRHIVAHGLTPNERGQFTTPIARDFKGRRSLKIDPRDFGFCRNQSIVVDMLATCPNWKPVNTAAELASRIR